MIWSGCGRWRLPTQPCAPPADAAVRLEIVAVGRLRDPLLRALVDRYLRRIPWQVREIEVEPASGRAAQRRQLEGERLLARSRGRRRIVLDARGDLLDSPGFARLLARGGRPPALLVGGAEGLDEVVLAAADHRLSLGPMTWPHELVRVMLAEQLYRAWAILHHHPYHRDVAG